MIRQNRACSGQVPTSEKSKTMGKLDSAPGPYSHPRLSRVVDDRQQRPARISHAALTPGVLHTVLYNCCQGAILPEKSPTITTHRGTRCVLYSCRKGSRMSTKE